MGLNNCGAVKPGYTLRKNDSGCLTDGAGRCTQADVYDSTVRRQRKARFQYAATGTRTGFCTKVARIGQWIVMEFYRQ